MFSLAGAGMIAGLGRRARSDVATALTIVLMLALGDLFLSRTSEYAPEIFSLLFGEVLGVSTSKLAPTVVIAAVCIVAVVVLYRPLMLSSVAPDVAAARGINPRLMDLAFLIVVALVTTMAVPVVGSLLIFSLLIGPPAAARSFTNRPPVAIALSVVFALLTVWLAIAASYETNLPIGFFVGTASAFAYTVGRVWSAWRQGSTRRVAVAGLSRAKRWYPAKIHATMRNACASPDVEMNRTNSSAVARAPFVRSRHEVDDDRGDGQRYPERNADGRAGREQQPRRVRMRAEPEQAGPEEPGRVRASGLSGLGGVRRCSRVSERCADPCGFVADADQHPDQEEACIQRPVRLGQGADRQVILVRPGVDAEDVPRQRDEDQEQPRRDPTERAAGCRPVPDVARDPPRRGRRQPRREPCDPRQSAPSATTTATTEAIQLISAASDVRCKPLAQPHHAQSAIVTNTTTITVRGRTPPVYPQSALQPK